MTEAWTRGGYYVQTSADVETATRIARAVLGHEPEVRRTNLRVGFLQADADQNLLAPVWFTCRAEVDLGYQRREARKITWALRRRLHHARRRYSAPLRFRV
ncbi:MULTISPECIES: hypothetical protein [Amycolatopsis]|uniref:Uncharacterized protein n=1 Tax=Amycolatopsis tucumanensis TaxID=401106 RepID=A0ABP7HUR5_9PSEU|nr:hypothetical protein [Amycolatopsis tucumanensis]MCF6421992.1 hypothetical protein [Amycolatopsis tucumanensis]